MISFKCSACQKKLSVKDELSGRKVKCPSCGRPATIPANHLLISRFSGVFRSLHNHR